MYWHCIKKEKKSIDRLYDKGDFCNFGDGEVIYLSDSFQNKVQLFPVPITIKDDLTQLVTSPVVTSEAVNAVKNYKLNKGKEINKKSFKFNDHNKNRTQTQEKSSCYIM